MIRWNNLRHIFRYSNGAFLSRQNQHPQVAFSKRNLSLFTSERVIQRSQHLDGNNLNSSYLRASLCTSSKHQFKDNVTIHFNDRNGTKISVQAEVNDNLLDVAKDADIDGVEGACGGTLACSTCHCIFKQEDFDRLELEDISEDELDMLDLAYGLTDTSRLVCALDVTEEMDGIELSVPMATNDARS